MHPLRLLVLGVGSCAVGAYFWAAHRQLTTWQAEGDRRAGRWKDDGHLGAWRGLIPMGIALIVASVVGGLGGSPAAVWAAGFLTLGGCAIVYSPVLRRYPQLDVGQRATRDEIFSLRLSREHGVVFWSTIVLLVVLVAGAVFALVAS